jgi:hypothetical protein
MAGAADSANTGDGCRHGDTGKGSPWPQTPFRKGIAACFLASLVMAGAAALGHYLFASAIPYVAMVAIATFLLAWRTAAKTSLFNKEAVDAFYYSIGLLGVLVFFASEYPQRVEREALETLRPHAERRDAAREALADHIVLSARSARIRTAFAGNATDILAEVRRMEVAATVRLSQAEMLACQQAEGLPLHGLRDPGDDGRFDPIREHREAIDRAMARAACDTAVEALQQRIMVARASTLSPAQFLADGNRFDGIADRRLVLGDELVVSVGDLRAVLRRPDDPATTEAERRELEATLTQAEQVYESEKIAAQTAIDEARLVMPREAGLIALVIWPYVLILLLGLKLARPRG